MRMDVLNTDDKGSLDQLFEKIGLYKKSYDYIELMNFIIRFPGIAPFNAFLLHVQRPGSIFVETAEDWRDKHHRTVKPGARPLVILKPFRPVVFVYDILDTVGENDEEYRTGTDLFKAEIKTDIFKFRKKMGVLIDNLSADGIILQTTDSFGSGCGGPIGQVPPDYKIPLRYGEHLIKPCYNLMVNSHLEEAAYYTTIMHELGHLFCGHLGTPDKKRWPNRSLIKDQVIEEFEAESVSWLLCERLGIHNPSAAYLSSYISSNETIPKISIENVLKAVGMIETRMKGRIKPCKKLILDEK